MTGIPETAAILGISKELLNAGKSTIDFFKRRKKEEVPRGEFIKKIRGKYKQRYGIELSKESADYLLYKLRENGSIHMVKSRHGHWYVIPEGVSI